MFTHRRIILALLVLLAGSPVKAIAKAEIPFFRAGYRYITSLGESLALSGI
jgi:hypothetical protein